MFIGKKFAKICSCWNGWRVLCKKRTNTYKESKKICVSLGDGIHLFRGFWHNFYLDSFCSAFIAASMVTLASFLKHFYPFQTLSTILKYDLMSHACHKTGSRTEGNTQKFLIKPCWAEIKDELNFRWCTVYLREWKECTIAPFVSFEGSMTNLLRHGPIQILTLIVFSLPQMRLPAEILKVHSDINFKILLLVII